MQTNAFSFFARNPTLEECKTRFVDPQQERWGNHTSLLHIFVGCYTGSDPIPIMQWLLGPPHCISIEIQCPRDNGTPLMMAAYQGKIIMIHALVTCGADLNAQITVKTFGFSPDGNRCVVPEVWTVLDYACHTKADYTRNVVLCLLDHGANACCRYEIPDYGHRFLTRRKRLFKSCIIVLGMCFRRPLPFDRWLLPIIAKYIWAHRFDEENE